MNPKPFITFQYPKSPLQLICLSFLLIQGKQLKELLINSEKSVFSNKMESQSFNADQFQKYYWRNGIGRN